MSSLKSIELAERSSDSSGASTSNCVLRLELERQNEMKARLSLFRPQLENFARHKLFLDADLLELPKVKELVEENEGRIPVTDDRWLAVQNILFDAVKDHANKIEDDCNGVIENAKTEALQAVKDRWFEKRTQKWEERQEKRQKEKEARERQKEEREADSDSNPSDDSEESIYDPHPSEYDDPPDHFEELDCLYNYDDDAHTWLGIKEDEDRMPSRLLSASSLVQQECNGIKKLTSYADILRRRALKPLPGESLTYEPLAWCKEKITSSGQIVETAMRLLKYFMLPIETTMVYMAACGKAFRCIRCYRGPASKGVKWPELVQHFITHNEIFEELCRRNSVLKVPLRNDHSLEFEDVRSQGFPVSRPSNLNLTIEPLSVTGSRYTQMSATWGFEVPDNLRTILDADGDDDASAGIPLGDLDHDSMDDFMLNDYDVVYSEKCKLCAKLDVAYAERSPIRLKDHMKMKHGTDLDGNLLNEEEVND